MVEVRLRPGVPGCVMIPVAILTLGLIIPLLRMGEKHFIANMDEDGFTTRAGNRFSWSEVQRMQRTIGKVKGHKLSDEILLFTGRGRASLPTWRVENANEVLAFLLRHAPQQG